MKLNTVSQLWQKSIRWSLTWVSVGTMVWTPVAMGQEAQRITQQQIQGALDTIGLNRQMTVGEFYIKNKELFPERIRRDLEPALMKFKNERMPQFEVVSSKATDGADVATVRVSSPIGLLNLQWFGEPNRYLKFQNTNLTEIDIINFDDMLHRVMAGDEKIRRQFFKNDEDFSKAMQGAASTAKAAAAGVVTSSATKKTMAFAGMPTLSKEAWAKMSMKERAGYIIQMRLLWNDARRVLQLAPKQKTSRLETTSGVEAVAREIELGAQVFQKWASLLMLLNPAVQAKSGKPKKPVNSDGQAADQPDLGTDAGSKASGSSNSCIVAGYISKYKGNVCDVKSIYSAYDGAPNELVQKANAACADDQGSIACNPFIYGTPNGAPKCVTPSKKGEFQVATHFDGPCDKASRLTTETKATSFLKKDLKNGSRYDNENRSMSDAQLQEQYESEQGSNPQLVDNFVNGLLKFKGLKEIKSDSILTTSDLDQLVEIQGSFNKEITSAKNSCEAAAKNKKNEKNFWGACDQLHRRFLSVANFLKQTPGCKDKGEINSDSLMCSCPAPKPGASSTKEVPPGASCSSVPDSPAADSSAPPANGSGVGNKPPKPSADSCEAQYPGISQDQMTADCKCKNGKQPVNSSFDGQDSWSCGKAGGDRVAETCGFFCSAGKFLKKFALPVVATAAVGYLLYKLLKPKIPKLNAAADTCPNGSKAPCTQKCSGNFVALADGTCGCNACGGGQVVTSSTDCTCVNPSTSTTTTYTCPDGTTKVTDLSSCPASLTCPDGTKVVNLINCPVTTSSASGSGSIIKSTTNKNKK